MPHPPLIDVHHLRFRWRRRDDDCLVVDALKVQPGERVFLFGPSGSGKSSLLSILGGVSLPQSGSVKLLGTELTTLSARGRDAFRAEHIGYVFQQFNLIPYLSVTDNVVLPCRFSARRAERAKAQDGSLPRAAERLLDHLEIGVKDRRRPVVELSVGQQQRVAAARALIGRPRLIIADEPTSALDAERQAGFLHVLSQECAAAGSTLLMVSHDARLQRDFTRLIDMTELNRAACAEERR